MCIPGKRVKVQPPLWLAGQRLANNVPQILQRHRDIPSEVDPDHETIALHQSFKFAQSERAIQLPKSIGGPRYGKVDCWLGRDHQELSVRQSFAVQMAVVVE